MTGRTAKRPDPTPRRGKSKQKGVNRMSIEFFKLPAALKRAIWAAYLAEWQKKKAANRTTG